MSQLEKVLAKGEVGGTRYTPPSLKNVSLDPNSKGLGKETLQSKKVRDKGKKSTPKRPLIEGTRMENEVGSKGKIEHQRPSLVRNQGKG